MTPARLHRTQRVHTMTMLHSVFSELRQTIRSLNRRPGFALIALFSLALGLGVNTAVFSVVSALLFRPLPYADADRIFDIYEHHPVEVCAGCGVGTSYPMYMDIAEQAQTVDRVAAYRTEPVTVGFAAGPERRVGGRVSASMFPLLGIEPLIGRVFEGQEDEIGAAPVVLISERLWRSRFDGSPVAVGSSIRINGEQHTVIGVMPDALSFPPFAEVWMPLAPVAAADGRSDRAVSVIARQSDTASEAALREEMRALGIRAEQASPATNAGWTMHVMPLRDEMAADYANSFLLMLAVVAFVLLVACLNLANVLLARAFARRHEIAIHAALGASRFALVRRFMLESLVLSLAAGVIGVMIATWALDAFRALIPAGSLPAWIQYDIDVRVVLFATMAAVFTGLIVGIVPAIQASRVDLKSSMVEGQRTSTVGRSTLGARSALVVVQVAASLVLVSGAGFFAREFIRINAWDPGYDRAGLYTGQITASSDRYSTDAAAATLADELVSRIGTATGTDAVALSSFRILNWPGTPTVEVRAQGRTDDVASAFHRIYNVTPGYFNTLGIAPLAGRDFASSDSRMAPRVAIMGEALARALWPGENPLGRQVHLGGPTDDWVTIIGIVPSSRQSPFARDISRILYLPLAQQSLAEPANEQFMLHLRHASIGASLQDLVRGAVRDVDEDLVLENLRSAEDSDALAAGPVMWSAIAVGGLGLFAVLLAAMGLYGVIAFNVTRRMPELGIRFALGATRTGIIQLVLRHALGLAGIGIAIGIAGAIALGNVLRSQFVGTHMPGPLTFVGLIAGFIAVTIISSWLPARRAGRVDPIETLRRD